MSKTTFSIVVFILAFFSVGCRSMDTYMPWKNKTDLPEVALIPPNASLQDIIAAVNRQNSQIQSLTANQASVSAPRTPMLTAEVNYYQPNYLHLSAQTSLSGKEVDLGSNPELFWFWVARNEPAGVYYCRHDQYARSGLSQQLPIEPGWVIESLGVKPIPENLAWQGPQTTPDGLFYEIQAKESTPRGLITRQIFIDRRTATIAAQRLYDSNNILLVDATVKKVRRDALSGIYAPQKIEIYAPKDSFRLTIDLGAFDLNRISSSALSTWGVPQNLGAPMVNMASPQ